LIRRSEGRDINGLGAWAKSRSQRGDELFIALSNQADDGQAFVLVPAWR
jgi:hypothetical protein